MAYSFQTFSIGQILTAAQMNQVEASIRDHQHGVAGVSSSGMTFASPVFTTQITTPKIVTASGNLEITPVGNADIILQGSGTGRVGIKTSVPRVPFQIGDYGASTGLTDSITATFLSPSDSTIIVSIQRSGTNYPQHLDFGVNQAGLYSTIQAHQSGGDFKPLVLNPSGGNVGIRVTYPTASVHLPISSVGNANTGPLKFTLASTVLLVTPEAGVLEPDSSGGLYFTNSSAVRKKVAVTDSTGATLDSAIVTSSLTTVGTLGAGTVPLARMMRREVQASGTTSTTLDMLTVNAGDRILLSGQGNANPITRLTWSLSSGTATIDFMGYTALETYDAPGSTALNLTSSGICRVTGTGTLVLSLAGTGTGTVTVYGHAIVLNNG